MDEHVDAGVVTGLVSQLGAQDNPSWSLPRPPSIRSLGPAPLLLTLDLICIGLCQVGLTITPG